MAEGTRIQLSPTQVVASALATTSAAVAASFIGVYGTIIGAAVMSVISTVGATVYEHSIHRSKAKLRDAREQGRLTTVPTGVAARMRNRVNVTALRSGAWGRLRAQLARPAWWKAVGAVSALVFAVAIATITVVELAANKPMYALTSGGEVASGGTSISRGLAGGGETGDGGQGESGEREGPANQQPGSGDGDTDGGGSDAEPPAEAPQEGDDDGGADGDGADPQPRDREELAPEDEGGEPDTGSSPDAPDGQLDEPDGESGGDAEEPAEPSGEDGG